MPRPSGQMPPPDARQFKEGDRLVAVKPQSPKIPEGTYGEVLVVLPDTNEIHIQWNIKEWPYVKVTKGSPTNGYEKIPRECEICGTQQLNDKGELIGHTEEECYK